MDSNFRAREVSSHTARPRALKVDRARRLAQELRGFIPYGSTESTESAPHQAGGYDGLAVSSHTARPRALKAHAVMEINAARPRFIPYGSTESTESSSLDKEEDKEVQFHPIRLDREH